MPVNIRRPSRCISLTASAMGNVVPSRRCPRTPDADDVRLTRLAVARQVAIPADRARAHADVLPNHGGGGIPKEALRRRIEATACSSMDDPSTAVWRMA